MEHGSDIVCASRPIPAWHQIADMGFSDVVEASGYKRTGKAHWQWHGDGIVYHFRLIPARRGIKGAFFDYEGIFYPKLQEVADKLGIFVSSDKIPGTKILCHREEKDVLYAWYRSIEYKRYRSDYPMPPPMKGPILWQIFRIFFWPQTVDHPNFFRTYMRDLRFHGRPDYDELGDGWLTEGEDLQKVTKELCRLWEYRNFADNHYESFQEYYEDACRWPVDEGPTPGFQKSYFLQAVVAQDFERIQKMVDYEVSSIRTRDIDEIYADDFKDRHNIAGKKYWKEHRHTELGKMELMNDAVRYVAAPYRDLRAIKEYSDKVNLPIQIPDLDYSIIEESDRLHAEFHRRRKEQSADPKKT